MNMKLRWFVVCNKYGRKTEPSLQVWNEDDKIWETIPYVECKEWEEDYYMENENAEM